MISHGCFLQTWLQEERAKMMQNVYTIPMEVGDVNRIVLKYLLQNGFEETLKCFSEAEISQADGELGGIYLLAHNVLRDTDFFFPPSNLLEFCRATNGRDVTSSQKYAFWSSASSSVPIYDTKRHRHIFSLRGTSEIRELTLSGNMNAVLDLFRGYFPQLLQPVDPVGWSTLFALHTQYFIESIRAGNIEFCLDYVRDHLAPFNSEAAPYPVEHQLLQVRG
jgi:hypothetical protein